MSGQVRRFCRRMALLLLPALTAACASVSGWETEKADADFPDGMSILGEVITVLTREESLSDQGLLKGWREKLIAVGYSDEDITDGSEVTVWAYCYGHNSGVPLCAHHGHFVAHVPPELRGKLGGDPDGETDTSGDLVEIELTRSPTGALVGEVVAIYRKADDWSPCRDASLERGTAASALMSLSAVGPPRASWIECSDEIDADGWVRRPTPGAPASEGPPVSVWVKTPQ